TACQCIQAKATSASDAVCSPAVSERVTSPSCPGEGGLYTARPPPMSAWAPTKGASTTLRAPPASALVSGKAHLCSCRATACETHDHNSETPKSYRWSWEPEI